MEHVSSILAVTADITLYSAQVWQEKVSQL